MQPAAHVIITIIIRVDEAGIILCELWLAYDVQIRINNYCVRSDKIVLRLLLYNIVIYYRVQQPMDGQRLTGEYLFLVYLIWCVMAVVAAATSVERNTTYHQYNIIIIHWNFTLKNIYIL